MEEDFPPDEEYDRQCGEIFLTTKGELLIHCTLCEARYKGFQNYAEHISKVHCPQNEADFFQLEEFLNFYKRDDDSFEAYHELVENDDELELFSSNDQNTETDMFLMSEKFDINSEISEDLKTEEHENLLGSSDDMQVPQAFKYRFNASRKANTSPTKKKNLTHYCPQCNFSCNDKSNLVAHINRHSAYKPHQCESCAKTFYTRTELVTHIRSHTGERPFLCPDCGQGFITSSKLKMHIKRHASNRDLKCKICGLEFLSYRAFKRHTSVHNLERPFKCLLCDATFKLKTALQNHINSHDNNFEYKCSLCPATFIKKGNLKTHKKTSHGIGSSKTISVDADINVDD